MNLKFKKFSSTQNKDVHIWILKFQNDIRIVLRVIIQNITAYIEGKCTVLYCTYASKYVHFLQCSRPDKDILYCPCSSTLLDIALYIILPISYLTIIRILTTLCPMHKKDKVQQGGPSIMYTFLT